MFKTCSCYIYVHWWREGGLYAENSKPAVGGGMAGSVALCYLLMLSVDTARTHYAKDVSKTHPSLTVVVATDEIASTRNRLWDEAL